ncbi:MAG: putative sugar nucleotidyl transferase [Planctomycetaceae bacterium]|jgi:UDP-N-acetylglucosamine diphosphorylase/glucosamine-1-phosphate N-acetyltransferase
MRVLLFEDQACDELAPIALLRPAFELLCGRLCLRSRIQSALPVEEWGVAVRPWLADVYAESHQDCHVNDNSWMTQGVTLLVNGRWMPRGQLTVESFAGGSVGIVDAEVAWIILNGREVEELTGRWDLLSDLASSRPGVDAGGIMVRYPWDLVSQNTAQLHRDFTDAGVSQLPAADHVQCLGEPTDVYVSELATIDPYVVIDARGGPVSIGASAHVQPFTRIEGPCHIGANSQLFRAHVRAGTTIGPMCRVGGEIEESILHGYVTKYHHGFLGHSYVCPWVNIGAMTTTSDLKNNYSNVKVPLQGRAIDTGMNKVGTFFGDHSKTAIDSMFNTGSSIGVMSMVLPAGGLLPRHVPSFSSVSSGSLSMNWTLESGLEAARIAMPRRGKELTSAMESQLRAVYEMTQEERDLALDRAKRRRIRFAD